MNFKKKISQHKETIAKKWFELIINSYPAETARFLKTRNDPFANPVGMSTRQSLEVLIDCLTDQIDQTGQDKARSALDTILRIRAIQDFTPAQAIRFVFDVKQVIRQTLSVEHSDSQTVKEMAALDRQVDELGLLGFDIYMKCREKIYDLKANEIKSRIYKAFSRAGIIKESLDDV
ncbi:MAG: hypothetical protein GY874_12670 [Desulfobacteraceae bacterium]|nr:hypothetical protein [Desulfobacteraceae bacterium]